MPGCPCSCRASCDQVRWQSCLVPPRGSLLWGSGAGGRFESVQGMDSLVLLSACCSGHGQHMADAFLWLCLSEGAICVGDLPVTE